MTDSFALEIRRAILSFIQSLPSQQQQQQQQFFLYVFLLVYLHVIICDNVEIIHVSVYSNDVFHWHAIFS